MSDLKKMYTTLQTECFPDTLTLELGEQKLFFTKKTWTIEGEEKGLRYGENPDQPAALFELTRGRLTLGGVELRGAGQGLASALTEEHMLQVGKHPGKINITDVDNGLNILQYLSKKSAAVVLKHNNPCGAAWAEEGLNTALKRAVFADRIAAFGGTVVVNRPLCADCAKILDGSYFEVVAAPDYSKEALEILSRRKNLRILQIPGISELQHFSGEPFLDIKSLADGGLVVQLSFVNKIAKAEDFLAATAEKDGTTLTARGPDKQEAEDLVFAWAVEAGVTSNSVIFVRNGTTVAIGTGEQDRVGCAELTIHKAYTKFADTLCFEEENKSIYELKLEAQKDAGAAAKLASIEKRTQEAKGGLPGSVAVSDGFFPFRDGVDVIVAEGITAIAQPGGSVRDFEVIQAVNEASPQVAMVFTGQRSFRH